MNTALIFITGFVLGLWLLKMLFAGRRQGRK